MIKVSLKNGSVKEVNHGTTLFDIAKSLGGGLYKSVCAAKVDGRLTDIKTPIKNDCSVEFLTFDSEEGKKTYWHTSSHILAQAVKRLFPNAKLAVGPAIDNGFYYDFDLDTSITPETLEKIESEMRKIIKENFLIEISEISENEAIDYMEHENQPYKVQLIKKHAGDDKLIFRKQGEFVDLCGGTHLMSTGMVKAFKLTSCTGAYWMGDAKNKMLQRIYGISFPKESALKDYLHALEEAKKRDHKKLGKELGLFMTSPEGPGFPFFLPKGMELRNVLEDFWRKLHKENGYVEIKTPMILNEELWHRSGHWAHYKDNMYTTKIDDVDFGIKPMNCPGGMLVYKHDMHSYRDLPIRTGELGLVHRHEKSGELNGLFRVRCFTQDDAHIFCTPSQIESEIKNLMKLVNSVYSGVFKFEYKVELSTRPEDSMGSDEQWELAESTLKKVLKDMHIPYELNEGDGAFYGPKVDFHIKDCLGRSWQCGTIQLDFQMPERFDLTYIAEGGAKQRPVMLHRVIFGSIERFIGILIEHYAGAFPMWLAPEQVRILPLTEAQHGYALDLENRLKAAGISRVSVDMRNEKIGYKIRKAQVNKVPYMIVVGEKETQNNVISVRKRLEGDIGTMPADEFIKKAIKEIQNKD